MKNDDYQILDEVANNTITGVVNSAMPEGFFVNFKSDPTDENTPELIAATAVNPYMLRRATVAAEDKNHLLEDHRPTELRPPAIVGQPNTGVRARRIEVESPELVDKTTVGRLLNGSTPINAELTTLNGKLALRTDVETQELAGVLRQIKTPKLPANNQRFVVEMAQ